MDAEKQQQTDRPETDVPAPKGSAATPRRGLAGVPSKILRFLLGQWLVVGFGVACVLAYHFPEVAAKGGVIKSQYSILYGAVAFIFLVSGLQLSHEKLRRNIANLRLHLVTQGVSFVVIPCIMTAVIHIVVASAGGHPSLSPISTSILVGMVVLSCIPTTIASNVVLTRAAGGDDAAAIVEVAIGNVLGAFASPGLVYLFVPAGADFDPWRPAEAATLGRMYGHVFRQLGLSVLAPLFVGQVVRWFWEERVDWAIRVFFLTKLSTFCLVLLVWSTFSNAFQAGALQSLGAESLLFNIFMNVALYVVFTAICFLLARPPEALETAVNRRLKALGLPAWAVRALRVKRLSKAQTVAVCFCGAAKTTSLGIPLVDAMWNQASLSTIANIQIPVLLYTIEQVFIAQGLVYIFKRYLRSETSRSDQNAA